MKGILAVMLAVPLMAAAGPLWAADGDISAKNGTVIAESKTEEQAIVRDIDTEKRELTLAMPNGALITLVVDEQVTRFDKIQRGDVVRTTYSEAVSVKLRKTRTVPEVKVEESLTREPDKIKPAVKSLRQVTTTATIEYIAADFHSVRLKGADGKNKAVDVRNPDNLRMLRSGEVKVGDQIDITYTQAVAISVEKVDPLAKP